MRLFIINLCVLICLFLLSSCATKVPEGLSVLPPVGAQAPVSQNAQACIEIFEGNRSTALNAACSRFYDYLLAEEAQYWVTVGEEPDKTFPFFSECGIGGNNCPVADYPSLRKYAYPIPPPPPPSALFFPESVMPVDEQYARTVKFRQNVVNFLERLDTRIEFLRQQSGPQ